MNEKINRSHFVRGTAPAKSVGEKDEIISSGPMKTFPFSHSETLVISENGFLDVFTGDHVQEFGFRDDKGLAKFRVQEQKSP